MPVSPLWRRNLCGPREIAALAGVSRQTIYTKIRLGHFDKNPDHGPHDYVSGTGVWRYVDVIPVLVALGYITPERAKELLALSPTARSEDREDRD